MRATILFARLVLIVGHLTQIAILLYGTVLKASLKKWSTSVARKQKKQSVKMTKKGMAN